MSMRVKLKTLHFIHQVEQYDDWDEVEEGNIQHAQESSTEAVDAAIVADRKTVYATQVTKEALKQHLKLIRNRSKVFAAQKIKAKSTPHMPMPPTVNGKVLTAYLKNGRGLCAAYNVMDSCTAGSEEECGRVHLCAALRRRGHDRNGQRHTFQVIPVVPPIGYSCMPSFSSLLV